MALTVVLLCVGVKYGLDIYTHHGEGVPVPNLTAQSPGEGTSVKKGHTIYVTVNSPSSPTVTIPDIIDNSSVREATAKLTALGFKLLDPKIVTGEKDWVYGILCRGRRISVGDRVSIDLPLTLMIGNGEDEDIGPDIQYSEPNEYLSGQSTTDDFQEVTGPEQ